MRTYTQKFQSAAFRSTILFGSELNPEVGISTSSEQYGHEVVAAILTDFKDGVVTSSLGLPGNCFSIVREASYVLFERGIDHAVTIGNVSVNGKPQFNTTQEQVEADVTTGFEPGTPANAHAWLTLDSGQILDPTVLPSWAYHDENRILSLDDSIYLSGNPCEASLAYDPFLTGFAYHLHVVTHPIAQASFKKYSDWLTHTGIFRRNIARRREA